ncbi:MAG TPA: SMP-30/gluconolactonase/LRE family protein [Capillimicrobium sp.]|jgi:gluconolactonase
MSDQVEHLAEGLGHPEGPDVLPDGRIVFVETYRSCLSAWSPERGLELFADCGGGPNACMLGSDGAVYITQNGGTAGPWRADVMGTPSIQKATMDGVVEEVVSQVDGIRLTAPNDLSFGPDGRLYFTDPGDYDPHERPHNGYVFALAPDGTGEVVEELAPTYPNGIVVEADGSLVWVESYTLQVWRRRPDGAKEMIHQLPDGHIPDGLKVAANGDLWITTFQSGGVDVIRPDGSPVRFLPTGGVQCNCVFHDGYLYLTDFGDVEGDVPTVAPMIGRLSRVKVDVEGMPLFRGEIVAPVT